ncbi:MAG TPA: thioredoxin domain-containing protein [Alphaproteobacteria bacterium]|nr:thioredoxin domain-containing protein [Alphaproteobacteria bacterium]
MKNLLITTALLSATAFGAFAQAAPLTRAQVEDIVKQYIASHGDEVLAGINAAQQKKQAEAIGKIIRPYTPTKGPATAPVTIIEFADFECPFCYKTEPTIEQLQKTYGDKIRWVAKYLPLDFHKHAMPAAQAAAAAHLQGKYWPFAQAIFSQQDKLGDKLYTDTAKSLKLDMKKFDADRNSDAVKANIVQDLQDAESVGARGTPYFLINGKALSGALPLEEFTKIIDAELKGSPKK